VVVFDSFDRGHRAACAGVEVVDGDLRHADDLEGFFAARQVECVLHFAGLASVGESVAAPERYYENNVVGCWLLLEAMRRHRVPTIIFSSSAATYGEPRQVPIPEEHPQEPTNPYGESKKVMEQMLRWYEGAHGIRSVSLRYFNAAGADPDGELGEDHTPEEHLIPIVLEAALGQREGVKVFGTDWPTEDGTCIRDYVHVTDLAQAHHLALQRLRTGSRCEAYNLGNGTGYSVLEVIRTAESVTGRAIPWSAAPRRAGDPARLVASAARAREVLGWRPQYPELEAIVRTAWHWKRAHPHGYPKVVSREPRGRGGS
jgi:UDP-glucose 4-epimerase